MSNLPANTEFQNLSKAAQADTGMETLLKFKKGKYVAGGEDVRPGRKFIAHVVGWAKCWVKFKRGELVDRKMYRVAGGELPPERHTLDDQDEKSWEIGPMTGKPSDPWVYQYLLPMEDVDTGELLIFVTSSFGGKRAIADLAEAYSRRGTGDQPIITLNTANMPTKHFGDVLRPAFLIEGWEGNRTPVRNVTPGVLGGGATADMDDEIPF